MMDYTPEIVQVVPHENYSVSVFFCDGKVVVYDVKPKLDQGVFVQLKDLSVFMDRCTIMNDTLAWDITGTGDTSKCIDIDPDTLYEMECEDDQTMEAIDLKKYMGRGPKLFQTDAGEYVKGLRDNDRVPLHTTGNRETS